MSGIWAFTWPVAWIVIGVLLLMSTTGAIGRGPAELIAEYWPWALIALGIWFVIGAVLPAGRGLAEALEHPAGRRPRTPASGSGSAPATWRSGRPRAGHLVDGTFEGGVTHRLTGPGRVELEQDTRYGLPWLDRDVALDCRADGRGARSTSRSMPGPAGPILDLRDLRVRNLDLQTGASETRVMVPRAAGATTIKAQTGAASLTIEIPAGVAARIRTRMALGSTQVDQTRFPARRSGLRVARLRDGDEPGRDRRPGRRRVASRGRWRPGLKVSVP